MASLMHNTPAVHIRSQNLAGIRPEKVCLREEQKGLEVQEAEEEAEMEVV